MEPLVFRTVALSLAAVLAALPAAAQNNTTPAPGAGAAPAAAPQAAPAPEAGKTFEDVLALLKDNADPRYRDAMAADLVLAAGVKLDGDALSRFKAALSEQIKEKPEAFALLQMRLKAGKLGDRQDAFLGAIRTAAGDGKTAGTNMNALKGIPDLLKGIEDKLKNDDVLAAAGGIDRYFSGMDPALKVPQSGASAVKGGAGGLKEDKLGKDGVIDGTFGIAELFGTDTNLIGPAVIRKLGDRTIALQTITVRKEEVNEETGELKVTYESAVDVSDITNATAIRGHTKAIEPGAEHSLLLHGKVYKLSFVASGGEVVVNLAPVNDKGEPQEQVKRDDGGAITVSGLLEKRFVHMMEHPYYLPGSDKSLMVLPQTGDKTGVSVWDARKAKALYEEYKKKGKEFDFSALKPDQVVLLGEKKGYDGRPYVDKSDKIRHGGKIYRWEYDANVGKKGAMVAVQVSADQDKKEEEEARRKRKKGGAPGGKDDKDDKKEPGKGGTDGWPEKAPGLDAVVLMKPQDDLEKAGVDYRIYTQEKRGLYFAMTKEVLEKLEKPGADIADANARMLIPSPVGVDAKVAVRRDMLALRTNKQTVLYPLKAPVQAKEDDRKAAIVPKELKKKEQFSIAHLEFVAPALEEFGFSAADADKVAQRARARLTVPEGPKSTLKSVDVVMEDKPAVYVEHRDKGVHRIWPDEGPKEPADRATTSFLVEATVIRKAGFDKEIDLDTPEGKRTLFLRQVLRVGIAQYGEGKTARAGEPVYIRWEILKAPKGTSRHDTPADKAIRTSMFTGVHMFTDVNDSAWPIVVENDTPVERLSFVRDQKKNHDKAVAAYLASADAKYRRFLQHVAFPGKTEPPVKDHDDEAEDKGR